MTKEKDFIWVIYGAKGLFVASWVQGRVSCGKEVQG